MRTHQHRWFEPIRFVFVFSSSQIQSIQKPPISQVILKSFRIFDQPWSTFLHVFSWKDSISAQFLCEQFGWHQINISTASAIYSDVILPRKKKFRRRKNCGVYVNWMKQHQRETILLSFNLHLSSTEMPRICDKKGKMNQTEQRPSVKNIRPLIGHINVCTIRKYTAIEYNS